MRLPTDDKARKDLPLFTFLTEYFVKAFIEVCRVAVLGNKQHNPGQPLHWARHKSTDQLNTAFRHMLDHKMGVVKDTDGAYHLAKAIWRLSAELELTIEAEGLGITVKELIARLKAQPQTDGHSEREISVGAASDGPCSCGDPTCPGATLERGN